eukprot:Selendium_serpulae@DN5334_c1_g1_i1.p1
MIDDQPNVEAGDMVLGKLPGLPWWPGVVTVRLWASSGGLDSFESPEVEIHWINPNDEKCNKRSNLDLTSHVILLGVDADVPDPEIKGSSRAKNRIKKRNLALERALRIRHGEERTPEHIVMALDDKLRQSQEAEAHKQPKTKHTDRPSRRTAERSGMKRSRSVALGRPSKAAPQRKTPSKGKDGGTIRSAERVAERDARQRDAQPHGSDGDGGASDDERCFDSPVRSERQSGDAAVANYARRLTLSGDGALVYRSDGRPCFATHSAARDGEAAGRRPSEDSNGAGASSASLLRIFPERLSRALKRDLLLARRAILPAAPLHAKSAAELVRAFASQQTLKRWESSRPPTDDEAAADDSATRRPSAECRAGQVERFVELLLLVFEASLQDVLLPAERLAYGAHLRNARGVSAAFGERYLLRVLAIIPPLLAPIRDSALAKRELLEQETLVIEFAHLFRELLMYLHDVWSKDLWV